MSNPSHQIAHSSGQNEDIPTFCIEIETVDPAPGTLRVKLVEAPDGEGESKTYWMPNPLHGNYANVDELGQALYDCLFGKDISNEIGQRFSYYYQNECSDKPEGRAYLRILLNFSSVKERAEQIVSLPWELLYDGSTWLGYGSRISIARRVTTKKSYHQAVDASLRVLLTYAEPQVLPEFDGDTHLNSIAEALEKITWLDLVRLPHASRAALKQKIREGFHIIHFLGHGEAHPSQKTGLDAYIHLENPDVPGKSDKLSAQTLAEWFEDADTKPKLGVLTACQSGIADRFAILGTAQALLDTGLSAIVAFQAKLRVEEAQCFTSAFYQELASHTTVDDAVQAGRAALDSLRTRSLRSGTEESLVRLLRPKSMDSPKEDDMGKIIDLDTLQGGREPSLQPQTVQFPAWAVPILLLNGDSWLGQESPPPIIYWRLTDDNYIEMIYIPEGNFYIDKYPVTYRQYSKFVAHWRKPDCIDNDSIEVYANYPVAYVDFWEAQSFAQWSGRSLLSVKEWKQAALSGIPDKDQPYPWGYEFRSCCNTRENELLCPMPVKSEAETYKDNTNPSGMCGIIGNVAELATDGGSIKVCGGSYRDKGANISIQCPEKAPDRVDDSEGTPLIGFRCVAKWPEIKQAQRNGKLPSILSDSWEENQDERS